MKNVCVCINFSLHFVKKIPKSNFASHTGFLSLKLCKSGLHGTPVEILLTKMMAACQVINDIPDNQEYIRVRRRFNGLPL